MTEKYYSHYKPPIGILEVITSEDAVASIMFVEKGKPTSQPSATNIGNKKAAKTVGNAIHNNLIGIIIPCRRVIGFDNSLTGYAGGLSKKRWLLKHKWWVIH